MAQTLMRGLGLGGAGAAALAPSAAGSEADGASTLNKLMAQKDALAKQRAAAQAERDLQIKGGGGVKGGRGPNYDKATKELERIDQMMATTDVMIQSEMARNSPEGILQAERERKAFEEEKEAKERGLPFRERVLPGWAQDAVIPAATLAGVLLTRKVAGGANAEYQRALDRFMSAQKTGDVAGMALGKAQLAELEKFSLGNAAKTAGSALLPAEVRGVETLIDLGKPTDTRAFKEADERIHDPWAVGRDVVGTGISSLFAYGAGSKFAKPSPDRSLGRAIVKDPYAGAAKLADDHGSTLELTESLRRLGQSVPDAAALSANPAEMSPMARMLLEGPLKGPPPPPAASSNPTPSFLDSPANRNFAGHHSQYQKRDSGGNFTKGKPDYPDKK